MGYSYIGGAAVLAQVSMERAEADAATLEAAAKAVMNRQDIRWSAEAAVTQLGGLGRPGGAPGAVLPIWSCCRAPMARTGAPRPKR